MRKIRTTRPMWMKGCPIMIERRLSSPHLPAPDAGRDDDVHDGAAVNLHPERLPGRHAGRHRHLLPHRRRRRLLHLHRLRAPAARVSGRDEVRR